MFARPHCKAGFAASDDPVVTGPAGQRAHRLALQHAERVAGRLYAVCPGVWTCVGNGLSNQTFVQGPDGLIAIDTGESVQEVQGALDQLRRHTQAPVVAMVYTHFHDVAGTAAAS